MVKLASLIFLISFQWQALAQSGDLQLMNKARTAFENGKLKESIQLYSKVKPTSDFWLEALEEKAWAKTRQGQYEGALADLHSISSPVWSSQVGPETYMLSAFVSLKICAYKDVLTKINTFKKRILPRVDALQSIAEKDLSAEQWKVLDKMKTKDLSMVGLGKGAELFPRFFFRDQQLISAIKSGKKSQAQARIKTLANNDMDEIEKNLKKMKIIEVEVIQNVLTQDEDTKNQKANLKFEKVNSKNQITFPVPQADEEVWIDEVGHFEVKAQKCPTALGVSL